MPECLGAAILLGMFQPMRFLLMVLCVLVFAVAFCVGGEAVACEGCVHACCLRTERVERRRDGIVTGMKQASERVALTALSLVAPSVGGRVLLDRSAVYASLLAVEAAGLRI